MKTQKFIIGLQILKSIYDVRVLKKRIPIYCEWEVTSHCNMHCDFCSTRGVITEDTSTREALRIIEQLSTLGTKLVHFSGGEPTLREDLPELLARAKEKNMMVFITTNGSASFSTMGKLLQADLIRVSIDGDEKFHDALRRFPGAFERAVETIKFLLSKHKRPLITAVYTNDTTHTLLEALVALAKSLRVKLSLNILGRNLNVTSFQKSVQITEGLFCNYVETIGRLRRVYRTILVEPQPYLDVIRMGGVDKYGCRAMDVAIAIKPDGRVCLPCNGLQLGLFFGDIREIYYGEEAQRLRSLQGKHMLCRGCTIRCMVSASSLLRLKGILALFDSYNGSMG